MRLFDLTVNVANIVAIILFIVGLYWKWYSDFRELERRKIRFLVALFHELELNLVGLERSRFEVPAGFLEKRNESPDYRPLIVSSYTSDIYDANRTMLNELDPPLIRQLLDFYEAVKFADQIAKSVENKAYSTISPQARLAVIEKLNAETRMRFERDCSFARVC